MAEVSVASSPPPRSSYIEVHVELLDHPKTKRLARLLKLSPIYVQAHLVELWKWVMAYAPSGDLTRFDSLDIADGACWEGDPDAFVEALCSCGTGGGIGFLERTATGKLIVHDWHQYGGKLLVTRFCDRFRKTHHRQPTPEEIRAAGLFPPEMYAVSGIAAPPSDAAPTPSHGFHGNPPDSNVEERSEAKRSVAYPSPEKRSEEKPSRQPGVVDTASARARDPDRRRLAAALALPEGRGGEEAGAVPSPPAPPPDPDATPRQAIDEVLARHPDLAAELQAIEARKLAKGESIGSPQRWRAAMLQSLLRQRAQRQAAGHGAGRPCDAEEESPHADREEAVAARIVQAPRPRRPLPPDWLPGVPEEEARRLLNAAREALLCRRDPSPPGPERDAKLLALARGYWERAHPDQAPPWGAIGNLGDSQATPEGPVPVARLGSPQAPQVAVRQSPSARHEVAVREMAA